MRRAADSIIPGLAIFSIGLALAGFLLGNRVPSSAPASKPQIAAGVGTLLEYPSTWRPASAAPSIPALAIADSLTLAPGGRAGEAGLLSGRLSASAPGLLPAAFVNVMRGLPHTEVVDLANAQAYRYRQLHLAGYDRALELYVIPSAVEGPVALACYANVQSSPFLRQCEQIVTQTTVPGQSLYALSPNAAYAAQLARQLGLLDRQRLTLREQMHSHNSPGEVASMASALAMRFANTAASIGALEPPQSASAAQATLASSLLAAHGAYQELAGALTTASSTQAQAAQAKIAGAEAEVDAALQTYALLGYSSM
jgi:hypothetical protein